jgi:hypothetical protein
MVERAQRRRRLKGGCSQDWLPRIAATRKRGENAATNGGMAAWKATLRSPTKGQAKIVAAREEMNR